MTEKVQTGGTRIFDYGKNHNPRFSPEQRKEIEGAYEKYYERKAKEKKNKIWILIILFLLILIFIGIYYLIY